MFDIDIWVLISQTINFLILFWVLNRFLFTPVSQVISKRRDEVVKAKEDATAEYDEAKRLKAECQKRLDNIKDEMEALKKQKIAETNDKVNSIMVKAQNDATNLKEEVELEVFMERQKAWVQLRSDVVQLATSAAEKIIEESLDDEMHRKLIERTITKLDEELPDNRAELIDKKQAPQQIAEDFFTSIDEKGLKPRYSDFRAFVRIYTENEEFREVIESPTVQNEQKVALFKKVFSKEMEEDVSAFIIKLIEERHVQQLPKIAEEISRLYHDRKCVKGIRVRTRIALTPTEKKNLHDVLTKKFGSIEVDEVIDSNLVGGLIVQLNNQVVDDSIDARVKELRNKMSKIEGNWRQQLADAPTLAMF